MMSSRKHVAHLLLLVVSVTVSLALAEGLYRVALFSESPRFAALRNPTLYADRLSEDAFFILRHRFVDPAEVAYMRPTHPRLGWVGRLHPETLRHEEAAALHGRTPVLLYGDSFAHCVAGVVCFEDLLNTDTLFARRHYLLNYGIPGYGLDQIVLLLEYTIDQFEAPFVAFSFMTLDLDRNVLAFRGKPKPYFEIEGTHLRLVDAHLALSAEQYVAEHPPQIRSYVWRRVLFNRRFPDALRASIRSENRLIEEKKALAEHLLLRAKASLEARDIPYVFIVFHPDIPGVSTLGREQDWRDPWIKNLLRKHEIPFIWTKDLYRKGTPASRYILPDNGHPTTYFNRLIAERIAHAVENPSERPAGTQAP